MTSQDLHVALGNVEDLRKQLTHSLVCFALVGRSCHFQLQGAGTGQACNLVARRLRDNLHLELNPPVTLELGEEIAHVVQGALILTELPAATVRAPANADGRRFGPG